MQLRTVCHADVLRPVAERLLEQVAAIAVADAAQIAAGEEWGVEQVVGDPRGRAPPPRHWSAWSDLQTPRRDRMPCMVMHGDSNIEKTLIIAKFVHSHSPSFDRARGSEQV